MLILLLLLTFCSNQSFGLSGLGLMASLQSMDPGALSKLRKHVPDEGHHVNPFGAPSLRVSPSQPGRLGGASLLPGAKDQSATTPIGRNREEKSGPQRSSFDPYIWWTAPAGSDPTWLSHARSKEDLAKSDAYIRAWGSNTASSSRESSGSLWAQRDGGRVEERP